MQNKKSVYGIIAIIIIGLVAAGAYYYSKQVATPANTTPEVVSNEAVGLSFSYQKGEDGLALFEPPVGENGLLAAYLLMPTTDFEEFKASTEAREAPASISVFVYTLDSATTTTSASGTERIDRVTRLQNWAMDNDIFTSFSRAKNTPDIVEVDGVKALHYQADGLYQQDIYLVSYKNRVYMFVGQYNDVKDITYTSFAPLIETISFE